MRKPEIAQLLFILLTSAAAGALAQVRGPVNMPWRHVAKNNNLVAADGPLLVDHSLHSTARGGEVQAPTPADCQLLLDFKSTFTNGGTALASWSGTACCEEPWWLGVECNGDKRVVGIYL